jgi:hypothetical protein
MLYKFIAIIVILFVSILSNAKDSPGKNDFPDEIETIFRNTDVTGDGIPEEIILRIYGYSWNEPIKWTLTIKAGNSIIFQHDSDDTWLDPFFADKGYVLDCDDYLSCKQKYYKNNLLDGLVVVTDLSPNEHAFDEDNSGSIQVVARKELINKYHIPDDQASQIIESMISRLKNRKAQVLYVPISPVQNNFPIMYIPEIKGFITVYEW